MNIAFCINRLGLIGLGVTVTSLIRNCSASDKLTLYFLCADLSEHDKGKIASLLINENFQGCHHFIDFNPIAVFGSFRSLHGDWTTYGRLLLADVIPHSEVLYLDSDLVVELDVLELSNFDFAGKALAAVHGGTLQTEYENDFYINKAGLSPHMESFNAGVLLFNLSLWRNDKLKDNCLKLGNRFPGDLLSADQSILNAVFAGNFQKLPFEYNCGWLANNERPAGTKVIFHFIGSPKPWDLFGFMIHKGFETWKSYTNKDWEKKYSGLSLHSLKRAWILRRSYFRVLKDKFRS